MTRRLSGRSFHKRGAFTEKPRRPKRSRLWCGTASSALLAERSWRPGSYILIKSVMYAGARLWIARNVSTSNLYITRNRIGSQCNAIRLFANDVIIIGLVRADWPAPFSVTIGNPRADKLGRNGFECIVLRCSVDRERCVLTTFMHSAIENYSMLHLQRWMECRGIKRSGTKSLFMIISHNCQSCLCRQQ